MSFALEVVTSVFACLLYPLDTRSWINFLSSLSLYSHVCKIGIIIVLSSGLLWAYKALNIVPDMWKALSKYLLSFYTTTIIIAINNTKSLLLSKMLYWFYKQNLDLVQILHSTWGNKYEHILEIEIRNW